MREDHAADGLLVAFDTGGTFTDVVALDRLRDRAVFEKELSTPEDPAVAILAAIERALGRLDAQMSDVRRILGATTLVTNALIAYNGAKTALVTTRGFEDILDMRREYRYDIYDLDLPYPEAYVPRSARYGIAERLDRTGAVVTSPTGDDRDEMIRWLRAAEVDSVAVCFLHSYLNPVHERYVADAIAEELPELPVTVSAELSPEIREYERMSTAVINAYTQPIMRRQVSSLARALAEGGFRGDLQFMLSSGRLQTADFIAAYPAHGAESGPAAGSILAAHVARQHGVEGVVSLDMGGTTAKICVMPSGVPQITRSYEIARAARFKAGSGHPLRLPSVQLLEIGAGGGSIASVDHMGLLKVGPRSAEAVPGPASYGRGGTEATVTDANLVLGYLHEDDFLAGAMTLDRRAAELAVQRVSERAGMDLVACAWGIHEVANQHMSRAAMIHVAELGVDPRAYELVAFGGAGPAHAWRVARKLGIGTVVCPPAAGVASAIGLLVAPSGLDRIITRPEHLQSIDRAGLAAQFAAVTEEAVGVLARMGALAAGSVRREIFADMRYAGQGHDIEVRIPDSDAADPDWLLAVSTAFDARYHELHGRLLDGVPTEVVGWRLAFSAGDAPSLTWWSADDRAHAVEPRTRKAYFGDAGGWIDTAVYDRDTLVVGTTLPGPAIVVETESTLVVPPDASFSLDSFGSVVLRRRDGE